MTSTNLSDFLILVPCFAVLVLVVLGIGTVLFVVSISAKKD